MAATATATTGMRVRIGGRAGESLPLHLLDVDAYNRIVDSGALAGEHVELLDGVLVEMSPKSRDHVVLVNRLMRHFARAERWWLQVQDPIEVLPDSEPEPDLALAAQEPPAGRLLRTADLVVEVAVSTQAIDRDVKGPLYARAAIPTYWLIDIPARTVEVYTQPGERGYAHCTRYREDATLPCPLDGVEEVDLAALFAGVKG